MHSQSQTIYFPCQRLQVVRRCKAKNHSFPTRIEHALFNQSREWEKGGFIGYYFRSVDSFFHSAVYQESNSFMTLSTGGAKDCSDHRFLAPPAYTAQLPTLHQHRANNQYKTDNQIKSSLRVSSNTQAAVESPIQVLSELNVAWVQRSYENWYFQVDKPLRSNSL